MRHSRKSSELTARACRCFAGFPLSTPIDTEELFVARVLHWWLQHPEQPCMRCGSPTAVRPVRPCAHLVCHECWDMTDYSGCPICHRRIELDEDPFFGPEPISLAAGGVMQRLIRRFRGVAMPEVAPAVMAVSAGRLTRLVPADRAEVAGRDVLGRLLARTSPLSAQDRDDLALLADAYAHDDELWGTRSRSASARRSRSCSRGCSAMSAPAARLTS